MGMFIIYLSGMVFGGISGVGLYLLLSEGKRFRDFKREPDVSEEQIIATMAVFWPLTMLAVFAIAVGFFVHSVYVVFKNLFKMYKGGK